VPLTNSSLAIVSNHRGDPVLILSAFFELHDGPAPAGCPSLDAIPCIPGGAASTVAAGAVAVEHDDPFFAIALVGPRTLFVAGEGQGAAIVEFDPNWRSYTWRKRFPSVLRTPASADGNGNEAGDTGECDKTIVALVRCCQSSTSNRSNDRANDTRTRGEKDHVILGMTSDGALSVWDLEKKEPILDMSASAAHAEHAIRDALPLPLSSWQAEGDGMQTNGSVHLALLAQRIKHGSGDVNLSGASGCVVVVYETLDGLLRQNAGSRLDFCRKVSFF